MAPPSIQSVALANLQKSREFLLKVLDVCGKLPDAPGTPSDQAVIAAVAQLAQMTEAVIQGGGIVQTAETSPDNLGSPDTKTRRQEVILQMCLQQSEQHWLQARRLKSENDALRRGLKQVEADVVAARLALPSYPAAPPKPSPVPKPVAAARPPRTTETSDQVVPPPLTRDRRRSATAF